MAFRIYVNHVGGVDVDKKCNGQITLLFSENGATIQIYDDISGVCVVDVTLDKEQICQAMSRLAHTPCNVEYGTLRHVGKKMELTSLEFEIPECPYTKRKDVAEKIADQVCPEGWESDGYFGSHGSFFRKDGKNYARVTVRRWVATP